jgi:hypothetical protein
MNGWRCGNCRLREKEGITRTKEDQTKAEIRNATRPRDYSNCWNCKDNISPGVGGAVLLYENWADYVEDARIFSRYTIASHTSRSNGATTNSGPKWRFAKDSNPLTLGMWTKVEP